MVYFVREFGDTEAPPQDFYHPPPDRGSVGAPKFKDSEVLEGMMPNDLPHHARGISGESPDLRRILSGYLCLDRAGFIDGLSVIGAASGKRYRPTYAKCRCSENDGPYRHRIFVVPIVRLNELQNLCLHPCKTFLIGLF